MTTGIIIALAVVAILIVAAAVVRFRAGGTNPRRHFGPEYDHTVARHGGDEHAARRELRERLERHRHLRTRPLTAEQRQRYEDRWVGVQQRFVESPAQAVAEADTLLTGLLHDRGYKDEDALSVHHPRHVQGYRDVHGPSAVASTEQLREVLVRARELFDELVKPGRHDRPDHAKEPTPARHRSGHRFHLARSHR
jgi:hypothetical protein